MRQQLALRPEHIVDAVRLSFDRLREELRPIIAELRLGLAEIDLRLKGVELPPQPFVDRDQFEARMAALRDALTARFEEFDQRDQRDQTLQSLREDLARLAETITAAENLARDAHDADIARVEEGYAREVSAAEDRVAERIGERFGSLAAALAELESKFNAAVETGRKDRREWLADIEVKVADAVAESAAHRADAAEHAAATATALRQLADLLAERCADLTSRLDAASAERAEHEAAYSDTLFAVETKGKLAEQQMEALRFDLATASGLAVDLRREVDGLVAFREEAVASRLAFEESLRASLASAASEAQAGADLLRRDVETLISEAVAAGLNALDHEDRLALRTMRLEQQEVLHDLERKATALLKRSEELIADFGQRIEDFDDDAFAPFHERVEQECKAIAKILPETVEEVRAGFIQEVKDQRAAFTESADALLTTITQTATARFEEVEQRAADLISKLDDENEVALQAKRDSLNELFTSRVKRIEDDNAAQMGAIQELVLARVGELGEEIAKAVEEAADAVGNACARVGLHFEEQRAAFEAEREKEAALREGAKERWRTAFSSVIVRLPKRARLEDYL